MPDFVFNVAKGRVVELYNRVKSGDPANSRLVVVALATTGLESDAILQDADTLAAVVAGTTNEATNTGYARKVLAAADLAALPAPDDTNDRRDLPLPSQTWTAVAATGGGWSKLVVCYDPDSTGGTDADLIPLTAHDFVITPDGSDISATITNFYRAA